ncbi:hypothetical protein HOLleu_35149 [Holothuria leucospilota]|uniref:GIY-YIG domain-containing protein n=1 Tax=Holothuria leucospilota TaxID=206669 RepID=A0A9Q1BGP8_HOLLE|nr:hypothetical protein HOLleu_35149 [Holothuria leucospilota]
MYLLFTHPSPPPPHHAALSAIRHYLDQRQDQQIPTTTFLRLTELFLTQNCFQFNGRYFLQVKGVAMGTKMGPSVACLTMGHFEEQLFSQYTGVHPILYKRYIDDIVGVATGTRQDLESFIQFVGSFCPFLKFTHCISDTSVVFLDLQLSICDCKIQTPITAFRVEKNISKHFVRTSHPQQPTDNTPGTFSCGRSRCNTCPVVGKNTLINILSSNGNRFSVNQHFTCTSTNLVYILVCGRCNCLYVGETKRRLADRVTEHLRSIQQNLQGYPVATHFNPSRAQLKTWPLPQPIMCRGSDRDRQTLENRLIMKLGTLSPHGLNIRMDLF